MIAPLAGATRRAGATDYLTIAQQGVKQASDWSNHKYHWYNAVLHDRQKYPQVTFVDAAPLFEAVDYLAVADPTAANKQAVISFANHAAQYWDVSIKPGGAWAPYPGNKGDVVTYFDDNGWWSLGFLDAYTVTRKASYLRDAERDFKFISKAGWDTADGGGMWRDTKHSIRTGEALGADVDLAARLYEDTKQATYLTEAVKWITWADAHLLKSNGTYSAQIPKETVMPHDGEGAMLAAFTALCTSGAPAPSAIGSWCTKAETFAGATVNSFFPLNAGPQIDSIYVRGLLALYAHDHTARWFAAASTTAARILHNAREPNGLFLRAWDGSHTIPGVAPNSLRTHASSVSVFAALAAVPAPH